MNIDLSPISQPQSSTNGSVSPFARQTVTLNKQEYVDLVWRANYWQKQHARLVERTVNSRIKIMKIQLTSEHIFIATKPIDFRNYVKSIIMCSSSA